MSRNKNKPNIALNKAWYIARIKFGGNEKASNNIAALNTSPTKSSISHSPFRRVELLIEKFRSE